MRQLGYTASWKLGRWRVSILAPRAGDIVSLSATDAGFPYWTIMHDSVKVVRHQHLHEAHAEILKHVIQPGEYPRDGQDVPTIEPNEAGQLAVLIDRILEDGQYPQIVIPPFVFVVMGTVTSRAFDDSPLTWVSNSYRIRDTAQAFVLQCEVWRDKYWVDTDPLNFDDDEEQREEYNRFVTRALHCPDPAYRRNSRYWDRGRPTWDIVQSSLGD